MTLLLPLRWEHALVAATIEAASKTCPTCELGRTAIQKLLYFINISGVPMNYKFDIHHYGPFCADIMHDVDWLMADDVVVDTAGEARYSNYKPGSNLPSVREQFSDELDKYQAVISDVCEALSDLSPRTLELIATLDFSFRWVHARGGTGPWKNSTVAKFKEIKKDKFTDEEIDRWYQSLVAAKLIQS